VSLSFRDLKRGEIYLLTRRRQLWESSVGACRTIPAGAHFLVIDDALDAAVLERLGKVYRVLIDGSVGTLLVGEGDVLPVEEA
jgi:hypothetical protein